MTSSDAETLDAEDEEKDDDVEDDVDDDDKDDDESRMTSRTPGRRRSDTVTSCGSLSILDLLANSCRVTDL